MCKLFNFSWGVFCFLLLSVACSEDKKSSSFDPSQPVKFTEFMPDSGGIRTKFIIKGSNFGDDKSKVKVFFKDEENNEREALILGVTSDVIYTQVPKQAGGQSDIRVVVEGKEAAKSNTEKTFKYIVASSVSTVVGKAKEGGNTDGTLGETTFSVPQYVAVDNDDNIFVFDNPRTRLVSISQNKSITLYDGGIFDQPLFLDKERKLLFAQGDGAATGCFVFDANVNWVAERYGQLLENGGWMHSVVLDPVDSTYVVYRRNTGQLYTQVFRKGMSYNLDNGKVRQIGVVGNKGANGLCAYNPVDGYVYCALHSFPAIYRFKLKRGADGWPEMDGEAERYIDNGMGFRDGSVTEAQFNEPRGIAIDKEGNIYVADVMNHRIRKIDIKTNMVTTIAGNGTAGYKDGDPLDAEFNQPWGVCLDKDEFIYIADKNNHCIRKLAIE